MKEERTGQNEGLCGTEMLKTISKCTDRARGEEGNTKSGKFKECTGEGSSREGVLVTGRPKRNTPERKGKVFFLANMKKGGDRKKKGGGRRRKV